MAKSSKLKVMLSSRCNDLFPESTGRALSNIRSDLKGDIESATMFGRELFEVWINEDAPPSDASKDSWDVCLGQAQDCDIFIALFNGNPGWCMTGTTNNLGICHAELMTAYSNAPGKVYLVELSVLERKDTASKNFKEYVVQQSLFRGKLVKDENELKNVAKSILSAALIDLGQLGVRESRKGNYYTGAALDWSRESYEGRASLMVNEVVSALSGQPNASRIADSSVKLKLNRCNVLFKIHAIPAALGIAAAKERVGRPFLTDHMMSDTLKSEKAEGPVHVIACHKTATENQALNLLGFPDATVVSAPFGVFVADSIQKIQFAFITNCRDQATTRHGVQRFMDWLQRSGESEELVRRARSRAKIAKLLAAEASK